MGTMLTSLPIHSSLFFGLCVSVCGATVDLDLFPSAWKTRGPSRGLRYLFVTVFENHCAPPKRYQTILIEPIVSFLSLFDPAATRIGLSLIWIETERHMFVSTILPLNNFHPSGRL